MHNGPKTNADATSPSPTQIAPRRGRLLRLKLGYNPNSSSIGSYVFALPAALLALTAAFGAVTAFLHSALLGSRASTREATTPRPGDADREATPGGREGSAP